VTILGEQTNIVATVKATANMRIKGRRPKERWRGRQLCRHSLQPPETIRWDEWRKKSEVLGWSVGKMAQQRPILFCTQPFPFTYGLWVTGVQRDSIKRREERLAEECVQDIPQKRRFLMTKKRFLDNRTLFSCKKIFFLTARRNPSDKKKTFLWQKRLLYYFV